MFNDDEFEDNRLIRLKSRGFLALALLSSGLPFAVGGLLTSSKGIEQNIVVLAAMSLVLVILTIIATTLWFSSIGGKIKSLYGQLALRFGSLACLHAVSQFFVFYFGFKTQSVYPNFVAASVLILIVGLGTKKLLSTTK
jgi:hypothetical protein